MNHNIYVSKISIFVRIISIVASLFLLITNILILISGKTHYFYYNKDLWKYFTVLLNFLVILLLIIVSVFPTKIGILSIVCFIYAVIIIVFEPENQIGGLLFLSGVELLHLRGFFLKKKFLKNTIAFVAYMILVLTEIRFGFSMFLSVFFDKIAYLILMFINLFCSIFYYHFYYEKRIQDTLRIKDFPELNKRDTQWLLMTQAHKTYKEIAREYKLKEGTVRNRMNYIYKILECGDKIGFMNNFGNYKILFEEAETDSNGIQISS